MEKQSTAKKMYILEKVEVAEYPFEQTEREILPYVFANLEKVQEYMRENLPEYEMEEFEGLDGEKKHRFQYKLGEIQQLAKERSELDKLIYGESNESTEEYLKLSEKEQEELSEKHDQLSYEEHELEQHPYVYVTTELGVYK